MIDKQSILHAVKRAFPDHLSDNVEKIFPCILPCSSVTGKKYTLFLDSANICVPYRISFREPDHFELKNFNKEQIAIVSSILTRHHSGFIRQRWLERLLNFPSPWTTPFVVLLLGDYVIEILENIDQKIDSCWEPFFREFIERNPICRRHINQLLISYWDCYHRTQSIQVCCERGFSFYQTKHNKFYNYMGYRLAVRLGIWDESTAPNIIKM